MAHGVDLTYIVYCVLKAKFHYAIPLANQLASRFATWSATCQRAGHTPASELVTHLLATWTAMEFCLSRAILLASSSLAGRRAAANRSATAGSSYLDMSRQLGPVCDRSETRSEISSRAGRRFASELRESCQRARQCVVGQTPLRCQLTSRSQTSSRTSSRAGSLAGQRNGIWLLARSTLYKLDLHHEP